MTEHWAVRSALFVAFVPTAPILQPPQCGTANSLSAISHRLTTSGIPEGPARQTAETVLGVGEKVFDYTAAMSYTSGWFEREPKK